jgi:hypothetical protein
MGNRKALVTGFDRRRGNRSHYPYNQTENPAATRAVISEIRRQIQLLGNHPQIGRIGRVSIPLGKEGE